MQIFGPQNKPLPLFRRVVLRLHLTISSVFVLLTLPLTVVFLVASHKANMSLVDDYSNRFVDVSVKLNIDDSIRLFSPFVQAAASAATLMRSQPGYFRIPVSAEYLLGIVRAKDEVYSAYVAMADGSFRQVLKAPANGMVGGSPVPEGTSYITRMIDRASSKTPSDQYLFFDAKDKLIGQLIKTATYDPRLRAFYRDAEKQNGPNISDPYVFASSGELGITVTAPVLNASKIMAVVGVDLTLTSLSKHLADSSVSPGSLLIVADAKGGLVAHPEAGLILQNMGVEKTQNRLENLNDPRVNGALAERLRTGSERVSFHAGPDNAEYIATFAPFPSNFNKSWQLLLITPTDDFVGEIKNVNRRFVLFGAIAFLLQLFLIYRLSHVIALPMEHLEREINNIIGFNFDGKPLQPSRILEIQALSNAVRLLKSTLQSFTSYVPRGLVKQLIDSGVGTRLGVESRYLTMLFTDIEDFSTISEIEPSQQLLKRVSEYFSIVSGAIEHEGGTVDKYIGDAVMAFWGAPFHHEQHAYAACVAAVRASRRLAVLNSIWREQNLHELKLRIGIHSDAVLVGNIGSAERMSYTVMGDGVNVASRLEGLNKEMGTWICMSHSVYREAGERLCLRPIDSVAVKGRKGELLVYELLGIRDGDSEVQPTSEQLRLCELTSQAYAQFAQCNWSGAEQGYMNVVFEFPDDPVGQRMLSKSQSHLGSAPKF